MLEHSPLYPFLESWLASISKWIIEVQNKPTNAELYYPTVREHVEQHLLSHIENEINNSNSKYPQDTIHTSMCCAYALSILASGSAHAKLTLQLLKDRINPTFHATATLGLLYLGEIEKTDDIEVLETVVTQQLLIRTPSNMLLPIFKGLTAILQDNQLLLETLASQIVDLKQSNTYELALGLLMVGEANDYTREIIAKTIYQNNDHDPYLKLQEERSTAIWKQSAEQNKSIWNDLISTLITGWNPKNRVDSRNPLYISYEERHACAVVLRTIDMNRIDTDQLKQLIQLYEEVYKYSNAPIAKCKYMALIAKCANTAKHKIEAQEYIISRLNMVQSHLPEDGVISGLHNLQNPDEKLITEIIRIASSDVFPHKGHAITTLGEWGLSSERIIQTITYALDYGDGFVVQRAKEALEKIQNKS